MQNQGIVLSNSEKDLKISGLNGTRLNSTDKKYDKWIRINAGDLYCEQ